MRLFAARTKTCRLAAPRAGLPTTDGDTLGAHPNRDRRRSLALKHRDGIGARIRHISASQSGDDGDGNPLGKVPTTKFSNRLLLDVAITSTVLSLASAT